MSNSKVSKTERPTTPMPVVTMEEVPVLSDEERAELLRTLHDAKGNIAAGRFTQLGADEVEAWLREIAAHERRKRDGV